MVGLPFTDWVEIIIGSVSSSKINSGMFRFTWDDSSLHDPTAVPFPKSIFFNQHFLNVCYVVGAW